MRLAKSGIIFLTPVIETTLHMLWCHTMIGVQKESAPMRLYAEQIAQSPLLDAHHERVLAQRLRAGQAARQHLRSATVVSEMERSELELKLELGDDARETLILANLRLVFSVARRYQRLGLPMEDLVQEGMAGLLQAVEKYDWHRGTKFSTYAVWWIRQSITRALSNHSRTIRLPSYRVEQLSKIYQTRDRLAQRLGREPSMVEIAELLGWDVEQVMSTLRLGEMEATSLNAPVHRDDADNGERTLLGRLRDHQTADPAEEAYRTVLLDTLHRELTQLDQREAEILRLRFGLGDSQPHTLAEIGQHVGLTRERVRQIQKEALAKLSMSANLLSRYEPD